MEVCWEEEALRLAGEWLRALKTQKGARLIEVGHCLTRLRAGVLAGQCELHLWLQGALFILNLCRACAV